MSKFASNAREIDVSTELREGAKVFAARSAQCHHHNGATVPLALQTSLQAPVVDSVRQVIANGIKPPTGALGRSMPAFGPQMLQADVMALVRFLRARFGGGEAWKE